jgi:hypothetical protein
VKLANLTRKGYQWNWTKFHHWKNRYDFSPNHKGIIGKNTKVFGIGSCFAENVVKYVSSKGIQANFFPGNSRFYDILSVKQVFEHLFHNKIYEKNDMWKTSNNEWRHPFRHPGKAYKALDSLWKEDKQINDLAKKYILSADVIAITIGGAELWRNPNTKMGYTTIPFPDVFNDQMPSLAEVHTLTFKEHLDCLDFIYKTIRRVNPKAELIFTVSPHRMTFTVTDKNIVQATCQGKSTIRAAVGEFTDTIKENVSYFHSYEIVEYTEYPELFYDSDFRHVNRFAIEVIMNEFMRLFSNSELCNEEYYNKIVTMYRDKKNAIAIQKVVLEQKQKFNVIDSANRIKKAILLFLLILKK